MPLTSLYSLLHSWELNTYLYVMSNTSCKDHGAFLFFFFFFSFSILYHQSQQPVSELPMPWGQCLLSQRHWLYLHITCTRGFFNFPGVDQPLYMLWNGYCLLSLNPLYCDIYSSLTPRGWTKLSKTPEVYYICPAGLRFSPPLDPPLKCITENDEG